LKTGYTTIPCIRKSVRALLELAATPILPTEAKLTRCRALAIISSVAPAFLNAVITFRGKLAPPIRAPQEELGHPVLEDILPTLQKANVGGFVLPFANPRHAHEFRCFKSCRLDDDQILVAGVIDSLTNLTSLNTRKSSRIGLNVSPRWSAIHQWFWPAPIADSTPRPVRAVSPRMSYGQS
jgi:hypothetical protein